MNKALDRASTDLSEAGPDAMIGESTSEGDEDHRRTPAICGRCGEEPACRVGAADVKVGGGAPAQAGSGRTTCITFLGADVDGERPVTYREIMTGGTSDKLDSFIRPSARLILEGP